jgi:DNA polymerase I
VLYICGNYSSILSRLDRKFQDLEILRAFTLFQLMTVLKEARHSIILIEHDPLFYEDAAEMVDYVSRALSDAAKEVTVLLYSPGTDTFLEDLARNADRVWYFDEGPRASPRLVAKAFPKAEKSQTTLGAFTWSNGLGKEMPKPLSQADGQSKLMELEIAKQILEEIFHARPSDVEKMIQMRLEDNNWKKESWQEEEKLWPREFCLSD